MQLVQAKSTADFDEREVRSGASAILHEACFDRFPDEFFDAPRWQSKGRATPLGEGRGSNWLIDGPHGLWVLRNYRRGGAVARLSADRYFFSGQARTRSFREWRILAHLLRAGLPVPRPVGARTVRRGFFYRADLITVYIPHTTSVAHGLAKASLSADNWGAIGRCIRRFHNAGVWHADLNAHNILLDAEERVFLIDFDRARLRDRDYWKAGNLKRLRRSLDKLARANGETEFSQASWQALETAYSTVD